MKKAIEKLEKGSERLSRVTFPPIERCSLSDSFKTEPKISISSTRPLISPSFHQIVQWVSVSLRPSTFFATAALLQGLVYNFGSIMSSHLHELDGRRKSFCLHCGHRSICTYGEGKHYIEMIQSGFVGGARNPYQSKPFIKFLMD